MRSTLFLTCLLCLLYNLNGTLGQDERSERFANFLNASLSGFSTWLRDNALSPEKLPDDEDGLFFYKSVHIQDGFTAYDMDGKFRNRWYHYGNNSSTFAGEIQANLTSTLFTMELFHEANSDFILGDYILNGSAYTYFPIRGYGNFSRTMQLRPFHFRVNCSVEITPDGYFKLRGSWSTDIYDALFSNLELEGFEGIGYGRDELILTLTKAWYDLHFYDFPKINRYWYDYMQDIFAKTPVVDIIGEDLPPTSAPEGMELAGRSKERRSSFEDMNSRNLMHKIMIYNDF